LDGVEIKHALDIRYAQVSVNRIGTTTKNGDCDVPPLPWLWAWWWFLL